MYLNVCGQCDGKIMPKETCIVSNLICGFGSKKINLADFYSFVECCGRTPRYVCTFIGVIVREGGG
jgi:hypothetical protein